MRKEEVDEENLFYGGITIMNYLEAEKQRKKDNRKLIMKTFRAELKNKRKTNVAEFIMDVVLFLVAMQVSEFVLTFLDLEFVGIKYISEVIIIMALLWIKSLLVKKNEE